VQGGDSEVLKNKVSLVEAEIIDLKNIYKIPF
jgi:hypothetical protein